MTNNIQTKNENQLTSSNPTKQPTKIITKHRNLEQVTYLPKWTKEISKKKKKNQTTKNKEKTKKSLEQEENTY